MSAGYKEMFSDKVKVVSVISVIYRRKNFTPQGRGKCQRYEETAYVITEDEVKLRVLKDKKRYRVYHIFARWKFQ